MNPDILPDLGSVQYCLIDKTGTLTTNKFEVRSLILDGKIYYFNQAKLVKAYQNFRKKNPVMFQFRKVTTLNCEAVDKLDRLVND